MIFADAAFFRALREQIAPHLRTWPFVNVWLVGASTGETAYALAIALREEGLAGRLRVHATDSNEGALIRAREATYPAAMVAAAREAYLDGGGRASLTDYLATRSSSAPDAAAQFVTMHHDLCRDIIFAHHSPTTGASFNELQLIVCHGPITTRGDSVRRKALTVMHESLCRFGILATSSLGDHPFRGHYEPVAGVHGFFRKGDA